MDIISFKWPYGPLEFRPVLPYLVLHTRRSCRVSADPGKGEGKSEGPGEPQATTPICVRYFFFHGSKPRADFGFLLPRSSRAKVAARCCARYLTSDRPTIGRCAIEHQSPERPR